MVVRTAVSVAGNREVEVGTAPMTADIRLKETRDKKEGMGEYIL